MVGDGDCHYEIGAKTVEQRHFITHHLPAVTKMVSTVLAQARQYVIPAEDIWAGQRRKQLPKSEGDEPYNCRRGGGGVVTKFSWAHRPSVLFCPA